MTTAPGLFENLPLTDDSLREIAKAAVMPGVDPLQRLALILCTYVRAEAVREMHRRGIYNNDKAP